MRPRYPPCRLWTLTEEHKDAWQAVENPLPSDCRQDLLWLMLSESTVNSAGSCKIGVVPIPEGQGRLN